MGDGLRGASRSDRAGAAETDGRERGVEDGGKVSEGEDKDQRESGSGEPCCKKPCHKEETVDPASCAWREGHSCPESLRKELKR